ncbi:MAG: N-acetyl-alpha-D-glucosaminyl L-malate synthase BshA [Schleiferiaceae bacterium]|tara:strand:- start:25304 stop:26428 length:1125 start_codon:yes stop_codon:yes gene_type:complete
MRIGIVCHPTYGGSGVMATELGNFLAKKGHVIHLISHSMPVRLNPFHGNINFHEVYIDPYPLFHHQPYEVALASSIVETVKREKLDVLHVHYAIPHAYAAYMATQILKDQNIIIPFITTLHGTDITLVGKNPAYKPAISFSINHSSYVTAVSESLKKDTEELFDLKNSIEVIPNFVNLKGYDREPKDNRKYFANDNETIFCHVSNFRPVKRVLDVIKVFKKVQDQRNSVLIMVGDGPDRNIAEKLSRDLGIWDKVIFRGKTYDVQSMLGISDIFLLPSGTESFGLSALEAMASHVPVIATNVGGLSEVVDHNKNGFLENIGDVESMAEDALSLIDNKEKMINFSNSAREKAESFSMNEISQRYLELYQKLINEK